jgi:hypothetical protein
MRDALARLIVDPDLRQERARQARLRAQRFSASRMVRDYLDTYAQLKHQQEPVSCVS